MKTMSKVKLALTCAATLNGCTTLFKGTFNKSSDSLTAAEEPVVQRSGLDTPVVSSRDRDSWVDLHERAPSGAGKAAAALAAGSVNEAIREAKNWLSTHPRNKEALIVLGSAYAMDKQFERAELYAKLLDRYHPGTAESKNIQGIAAMLTPKADMIDFRRAITLFEQAYSASDREIAPGLNLGSLYLELGDANKAREVFSTASSRCGQCYVARYGYGIASIRTGSYSEARLAFEEILKQKPNDSEALYRLALISKNGYNDLKSAKQYLKTLLADGSGKSAVHRQAHVMLRRLEALDAKKVAGNPAMLATSNSEQPAEASHATAVEDDDAPEVSKTSLDSK
jgi:tetratricopeptide (TPR) repeat protein